MFRSLKEKVLPAHSAVLVVDVQNDYLADGGAFDRLSLDVRGAREIVEPLQSVIHRAEEVGTKTIYICYEQSPSTESDVYLEQRARSRGDEPICQKDSWGAGLFLLEPKEHDILITKHRYSGFVGTDLDLVLRSAGIRTLIMTGVASSGCVEATAHDGFMRDYYIVFLGDCTASYNLARHNATLSNIEDAYGVVVDSGTLIDAWRAMPLGGCSDGR